MWFGCTAENEARISYPTHISSLSLTDTVTAFRRRSREGPRGRGQLRVDRGVDERAVWILKKVRNKGLLFNAVASAGQQDKFDRKRRLGCRYDPKSASVLIRSSLTYRRGEADSRAEASPPRSLGPSVIARIEHWTAAACLDRVHPSTVCVQHSIRPWPTPQFRST